jgi:hypothetical protein
MMIGISLALPSVRPSIAANAGTTAGATEGVIGSGGSMPTGWDFANTAGLSSREIVNGTQVVDGVECFDLRMVCGAATNCNVFFPNGFGGNSAATGQVWGLDVYVQQIAGSGLNSPYCAIYEVNGSNNYISDHGLAFEALSTSGPFNETLRTGTAELTDALTVRTNGGLYFEFPGAADVTIRLSCRLHRVS